MDRLDLVIEVIWTSGSIDKLEIWPLSPGRAKRAAAGLDLGLLCKFLDRRSATEAMRDFRDALRAGR
jgi:hypothetical protein